MEIVFHHLNDHPQVRFTSPQAPRIFKSQSCLAFSACPHMTGNVFTWVDSPYELTSSVLVPSITAALIRHNERGRRNFIC